MWSFFRKPGDGQFDDELRFHLEALIDEKIAAGVPPEEARRQAAIEFGGRQQWKRSCATCTASRSSKARRPT